MKKFNLCLENNKTNFENGEAINFYLWKTFGNI